MVTWGQLKEKFLDKGFSLYEFQILVPQPMIFDPDCVSLSYSTREDLLERHNKFMGQSGIIGILGLIIKIINNMKQSKKQSAIESTINVIVGLVVSLAIQLIIYPIMDIPVTFSQNLILTFVFFVASFLRGYFIRRYFNNKHHR